MSKRILVVDDEQSMRDVLSILLRKEGYEVTTCEGGVPAIERLQQELFDMVITDLKMPGVTGIEVLRSARSVNPKCVVIVITAFGTTESAVEAMKLGAHDYLAKPFEVEDVRRVVREALGGGAGTAGRAGPTSPERSTLDAMIGTGPLMREIRALIPKLAVSEANVMITGESGTGKELAAKAIHEISFRGAGPFVTINCAAIPENLLESELFGHVKGAFTHAVANKKGLFELANGGTLFLDEIGDLPVPLQVKLLRVLEDGAFRPVGGTDLAHVDVRIISATNKDLKEALKEGGFRSDLFYRLNVLPLRLPPLRNRSEDIPLLIRHFMERTGLEKEVSEGTFDVLCRYPWWGNVRELENTMERLVVLCDGETIHEDQIPDEIRMPDSMPLPQEIPEGGVNLDGIIEDLEKRYLAKALEKADGVKTDAAKLLSLSFRSFRHRLAKYEMGSRTRGNGPEA